MTSSVFSFFEGKKAVRPVFLIPKCSTPCFPGSSPRKKKKKAVRPVFRPVRPVFFPLLGTPIIGASEQSCRPLVKMADFSPTKPWTINHGRCPPRTGHGCVGCCGLRSPGARKGGGGCTALGGGRSWRGHPPRASVPVHLSAAPLIPAAKPDLHLAPCTILHGKFVLVGFKQHRVTGAKGLDDIELSRKGAPCPQRAIVRVVPM